MPASRAVVGWNAASLAAAAASGLALQFLVARWYGPEVLGLFNQVLAIYLVASQFSTVGIQLFVQREAALDPGGQATNILRVALHLVAALAGVTVCATFVAAPAVARLFDSADLAPALRVALPGLWCFALSKTLLGVALGRGRRLAFTFGVGARPVLLLAALLGWYGVGGTGHDLPVILSIAEAVLALGLWLAVRRELQHGTASSAAWRRILSFGVRAMPSTALGDLNTRIDVLILGLFVADGLVGVYSLAAMLVEGVLQLPVLLRSFTNPTLARVLAAGDRAAFDRLVHERTRWSAAGTLGAALAGLALLAALVHLGFVDARFGEGIACYVVLAAGLVVAGVWFPFEQGLLQAGHPGRYSLQKLAVVLVNLACGFALTPAFGILGAATAYSVSLGCTGLLTRQMLRRLRVDLRGHPPSPFPSE